MQGRAWQDGRRRLAAVAMAAGAALAAGCASSPPPGTSAAVPLAGPRPAFSAYKDATMHRAPGSAAMRVALDGAPAPLAAALPAALASVTWAFATGECGQETWGGVAGPAMAAANVPGFVAAGKRYVVSTGGQAGTFTCASDAAFERFLATYASPALDGVDFDIEAGQTAAEVDALAARVAAARVAHPRLRWRFTIATLGGDRAQALAPAGVTVMQALRRHGLDADPRVVVNLMAMDYGPATAEDCVVGADGRCDMGRSAERAAERLHRDWGVPYARIALTPMIGGNDSPGETFTLADADRVVAYARAKGLDGVHFWSLDRDTDCPPGPASDRCNTVGGAGSWGYTRRFLDALAR